MVLDTIDVWFKKNNQSLYTKSMTKSSQLTCSCNCCTQSLSAWVCLLKFGPCLPASECYLEWQNKKWATKIIHTDDSCSPITSATATSHLTNTAVVIKSAISVMLTTTAQTCHQTRVVWLVCSCAHVWMWEIFMIYWLLNYYTSGITFLCTTEQISNVKYWLVIFYLMNTLHVWKCVASSNCSFVLGSGPSVPIMVNLNATA